MSLSEKNARDCADMCGRGHELANHMPKDKPYDSLGQADFAFEVSLLQKSTILPTECIEKYLA